MAPLAAISPRKENPSLRIEGLEAVVDKASMTEGFERVEGGVSDSRPISPIVSDEGDEVAMPLLPGGFDLLNILSRSNHILRVDWIASNEDFQVEMLASGHTRVANISQDGIDTNRVALFHQHF